MIEILHALDGCHSLIEVWTTDIFSTRMLHRWLKFRIITCYWKIGRDSSVLRKPILVRRWGEGLCYLLELILFLWPLFFLFWEMCLFWCILWFSNQNLVGPSFPLKEEKSEISYFLWQPLFFGPLINCVLWPQQHIVVLLSSKGCLYADPKYSSQSCLLEASEKVKSSHSSIQYPTTFFYAPNKYFIIYPFLLSHQ